MTEETMQAIFCRIADGKTIYDCEYENSNRGTARCRGVVLNYSSSGPVVIYNEKRNLIWQIPLSSIKYLEPIRNEIYGA